ncbi:hypothetical protein HY768_04290 [candidate division TA06 bacterium]|uniref:Uncharacterized protein n=1 Tax=candidate division TA06 bacterium TaxID=2250710 RepID=A0A933I906_UNCT6|nr:hypothetical protein [candidate division TA06 bacterium]
MQELAVEKRKVPVTIRCVDCEEIKGELFLSLFSKNHTGQETALEFMNSPERFFVLRLEADPPVRMMNKDRIVEVEISAEAELGGQDLSRMGAKEEPMEVRFNNQASLNGNAYVELPPAKSRLIDFLNQEDKFFLLRTGQTAHIINRRQISFVTPRR